MHIDIREFEFSGNKIRCSGTDRDPWFAAEDVAKALGIVWKGKETIASLPDAWIGVRKLRTSIGQRDGTVRFESKDTYVINEAGLYKFCFRSNKPAADDFTNWVAEVVLPSIRKTGSYVAKRNAKYLAMGKSEEWVEKRSEGIEVRKEFADTLADHDVEGAGFGQCTNAIYKPVLGGTAAGVKIKMGLKQNANLRDSLSTVNLVKVALAEILAKNRIEKEKAEGNAACAAVCRVAGEAVAKCVEDAETRPLGS